MLIDAYMKPFVMMDRKTEPNGLGGVKYEWVEGAPFSAAMYMNESAQERVAMGQGQATTYTVAVMKPMSISSGDRFKRVSDGLMLEATTNTRDMEAPPIASPGMQFAVFQAKAVEIK